MHRGRTVEVLEMQYRMQEGLILFPKDASFLYSARIALAADRVEEALVFIVQHFKQQTSLVPPEDTRKSFYNTILQN